MELGWMCMEPFNHTLLTYTQAVSAHSVLLCAPGFCRLAACCWSSSGFVSSRQCRVQFRWSGSLVDALRLQPVAPWQALLIFILLRLLLLFLPG